jgi:hypothetical protein
VDTDTDTGNDDTTTSKPRVVTLNTLTALSTLPPGRLLSTPTPTHEYCYSRVRFGYGASLQGCQVNGVVPTEPKY